MLFLVIELDEMPKSKGNKYKSLRFDKLNDRKELPCKALSTEEARSFNMNDL